MATLVLTVIGDDRAGLVDALAGPIADHGGNWDRSHMARLAGKFAGIVVVTVPDEQVDRLRSKLTALHDQGVLDVRIAITSTPAPDDDTQLVRLHLVGHDRPGIVHQIAGALAARSVSIEELETAAESAPMSGERLFSATAMLRLPAGIDLEHVRATLESIANELMVDLDLSTHGSTGSTRETTSGTTFERG